MARTSYDEHRNPTLAVIFGDGMTTYAARTPKYGRRTGKSDGATSFENRVFGVEVYCGPIDGEILIHTDELVRGGANFMIEIQRRGLLLQTAIAIKVYIYYNMNSSDRAREYVRKAWNDFTKRNSPSVG